MPFTILLLFPISVFFSSFSSSLFLFALLLADVCPRQWWAAFLFVFSQLGAICPICAYPLFVFLVRWIFRISGDDDMTFVIVVDFACFGGDDVFPGCDGVTVTLEILFGSVVAVIFFLVSVTTV